MVKTTKDQKISTCFLYMQLIEIIFFRSYQYMYSKSTNLEMFQYSLTYLQSQVLVSARSPQSVMC